MQKEYFFWSAVAVLALIMAGGAYSQLTDNNAAIDSSIQDGIQFLSVFTHLDGGELLVLHLFNQDYPAYGFGKLVEPNTPKLDDYHSGLIQFLNGETIDLSEVSDEAKSDFVYANF